MEDSLSFVCLCVMLCLATSSYDVDATIIRGSFLNNKIMEIIMSKVHELMSEHKSRNYYMYFIYEQDSTFHTRDTGCISTVNPLLSQNDLNIIINISNNMVMFEDKVKRIYIKDVSSLTFHTSPRTIHVRNYICYMIINSCNWLVS